MSFLVKGVVKKILEQYLDIKQLDIEKGSIVLASGSFNHTAINHKLSTMRLPFQLSRSNYQQLLLSIPIMDIMGKPILIKLKHLQLQLVYRQTQSPINTTPLPPPTDNYLRSLAHKLLLNMELEVQKLSVRVMRQGEVMHEGYIQKLSLKNSVSFLNANLLKKIMWVEEVQVRTQGNLFKVEEVHACVHVDDQKVRAILLLERVLVKVRGMEGLKKIITDPSPSHPPAYKLEEVEVKVNHLEVGLEQFTLLGKNIAIAHTDEQTKLTAACTQLNHEQATICLIDTHNISNSCQPKHKQFTIHIQHNKSISVSQLYLMIDVQLVGSCLKKYGKIIEEIKNVQKQQQQQKGSEQKVVVLKNVRLVPKVGGKMYWEVDVSAQAILGESVRVEVPQLSGKMKGMNVLMLEAFKFTQSKQQLIISTNTLHLFIQPSHLKTTLNTLQGSEGLAYLQSLNNHPQKRVQKPQKPLCSFIRVNQVIIEVGKQLSGQFFTLFQARMIESKCKVSKKKSVMKSYLESLMVYSPHDLSMVVICKGVRFCVDKVGKSTNVTVLDSLTLDFNQSTLALGYGMKSDRLFVKVHNQLEETVIIQQRSPSLPRFFQLDHTFCVKPHQTCPIFFTEQTPALVMVIGGQKSLPVPITFHQKPHYVGISFSYHQQCQHILCMEATTLTIKYKYEISVYDSMEGHKIKGVEVINPHNISEHIRMNGAKCAFDWELLQSEKVAELQVRIKWDGQLCSYRLNKLMVNHESYKLFGLYKQNNPKHYYHYLLQVPTKETCITHYALMPFLFLNNTLHFTINLIISCKKTGRSINIELPPHQTWHSCTSDFDFYMKQYIFSISIDDAYISDEHYVNTFFMVDEEFQTLILLADKHNHKQYIRLCQSFIHKTKVFEFKYAVEVDNQLECPVSYVVKRGEQIEGKLEIPASHSQFTTTQPARDDLIVVMLEGMDSGVHVPVKHLVTYGSVVLSFNFCKFQHSSKYYHMLVKLTLQSSHHHQRFTISPFVMIHNLCRSELWMDERKVDEQGNISLLLPLNTQSKFNNKYLPLNAQQLYDDIFNNNQLLSTEQIMIRVTDTGAKLNFSQLIGDKMVQSGVDGRRVLYSLVKNIKEDCIELYVSDSLYSCPMPSAHYFLLNNQTQHYFIMSSDTHYAQYILPNNHTQQQQHQTIFQKPNSLSTMLNKQKYDVFLCDEDKKNLHPLTHSKLEKLHMKVQRYVMDNFTIMNVEDEYPLDEPLYQISTKKVIVRFSGRVKEEVMRLTFQVKLVNVRILEGQKLDILCKDIVIASQHGEPVQEEQIVRIADESYVLMDVKMLGEKFVFLKNLFLKSKIIDVRITKHLLKMLIYFNQLSKRFKGANTAKSTAKQQKIIEYIQEKIIFIKSMHLHPINLSLAILIHDMDFYNVIALPELQISHRSYRLKSLIKDITNHYLTNIVAKFPKLSFLFQNLKNPISAIRSLLEARQLLKDESLPENFIFLKDNWSSASPSPVNRINTYIHTHLFARNRLYLSDSRAEKQKNTLICQLKNVVYNSVGNLGINNIYYLNSKGIYIVGNDERTNKHRIITMDLKQIEQIRITKYGKNDGQLSVQLKKNAGCLKIVDKISVCEHLLALFQNLIS